MPRTNPGPADDRRSVLLSAALRHVRDAEDLLPRSPDQAFHLAGFGPECARKATLASDWLDKVIGHGMDGSVEPLLELASSLDSEAARYQIRGWADRYPALARWTEQARYERTGTRSTLDSQRLVEEAREIVEELALALWMDGLIPGELP